MPLSRPRFSLSVAALLGMEIPAATLEPFGLRPMVLSSLRACCAIVAILGVAGEARALESLADLMVEKSVDEMTPFVGEPVVFTIEVTNSGPSAATGVEISDLLPSGLDFVSSSPSQGVYSDATGIWDFQSTQLAAGAMATLEITATVNPGAGDPTGTLALIDAFVGAGSGGLSFPEGLQFGPDGNLYVTSGFTNQVLRYDGTTGAFIDVFVSAASGGLNFPVGLTFGPDGNLYVVSEQTHEVLRYDGTTGAFIDAFVTAASGGLGFPQRMLFGPDGHLYVGSISTDEVLRYDGATGAFVDAFVAAASGGLNEPRGLTFGPDGNLYVSDAANAVRRYNGTTGAYLDTFVGTGLSFPQGVVFGPDGNLYVSSSSADEVRRYDGTTGDLIEAFDGGVLDFPRSLLFGPDGHLYVAGAQNNAVLRFDGFITNFAEVTALDQADPDLLDNRSGQGIVYTRADYGDAPDPLVATAGEYPTLLANDGARHVVPADADDATLLLGFWVDTENDGQPTATADGDDTDGNDDDDGVVFATSPVAGEMATVTVRVSLTDGLLNAWIDFDQDGVWGAGEQVFSDEAVTVGLNLLSIVVPASAAGGPRFARFRLDTTGGLAPTGLALDGEVEDHLTPAIEAQADLTIAKSDSPDPVPPGSQLTYTLTVQNHGPSDATGVVVTDTLPAGVTHSSTSGCAEDPSGVPNCTLGTIPAVTFKQYTITVNVDPGTLGQISNMASVTSATWLFNTGDDSVSEATTVTPVPLFAKSFGPDVIGESFDTTLTFTIDNSASVVAASDLAFLDTLPFDLLVAGEPNPTNSCGGAVVATPSTATISLSGGTVAAAATCAISVDVNAPSPGAFENVTTDLTSSSGNSGTASDTLTVTACAAPDGANLTLASDVVESPEQFEVCNTIQIEQSYQVLGPDGALTLRAGVAVVLSGDVEFGTGSEVVIETDPSLIP